MRRAMILTIMSISAFLVLPAAAISAEINVPLDQPTIQAGIDAAVEGDTVLVADGTWSGAGNTELDLGGINITVSSASGPAGCTIDCLGVGRAFVIHSGESRQAVVQGFTIINGGATGGGAIDIDDSDPSIIGNVFENNADSAIDTLYGGPVIHDNIFTGNRADGSGGGGAIRSDRGHGFWFYADIRNNDFTNNTAEHGGAIYIEASKPLIIDNTFTGNKALGGTYGSDGGAIKVGGDSAPEIVDNTFTGNTAETDGGAVYVWGRSSDPYIASNIFEANTAENGGAITAFHYALPQIINNLFVSNHASGVGGAVASISYGDPTLFNNTMVANSAVIGGGAVAAERLSVMTLKNCILYGNMAPSARGPEIGLRDHSTISIGFSDVKGGQSDVFVESGSILNWGGAMIDANPLLVSGFQGNHYLSQTAAGQGSDSPCLDAGNLPASGIGYEKEAAPITLDQLTTRTDREADSGTVDLGYHYPAAAVQTVSAELQCTPPAGILPFTTNISVAMTNNDDMITRRISGEIDFQPAAGSFINRWKGGFGNVAPGETLTVFWNQNIPNLAILVGDNTFTLQAEDVTPAPFNQPPYLPSGDSDSSSCSVGGIAP